MDRSWWRARYPVILLLLYLVVWVWAAVNPVFREDWLLENYLVFLVVPLLVWSYYRFRLSDTSYTLIFLFMTLHTIGSHYTYAHVPFGFWLQETFGLARNHYDRIVHFSFGLLIAYPIKETFIRLTEGKHGVWSSVFPVEITLSFSALFEIIEMLAALVSDPAVGTAFLGTQGDVWDAQKDMALATIGASITMLISYWKNGNNGA